ncbi:MAG TPA: helix-turn-helix transcriptional regulator [Puia sp.]|nr:helix-turn-helix transcriptional regulator [Puia sp.]
MKERQIQLTPRLLKILTSVGENIKLSRLRRKLTVDQVCERAGIGRTSLWSIERGAPNVALGLYAQVLFVLGMEKDLMKLGADDELGRRLQDANLEVKKRGPKRKV